MIFKYKEFEYFFVTEVENYSIPGTPLLEILGKDPVRTLSYNLGIKEGYRQVIDQLPILLDGYARLVNEPPTKEAKEELNDYKETLMYYANIEKSKVGGGKAFQVLEKYKGLSEQEKSDLLKKIKY